MIGPLIQTPQEEPMSISKTTIWMLVARCVIFSLVCLDRLVTDTLITWI